MRKKQIDPEALRNLIEVEGLQLRIVAELVGLHEETVRRRCEELGITRQRTGPRSGEKHPDWKGGVTISKGYRYIYAPDHPNKGRGNYVLEHRLVMEQKLGRYLDQSEVVHHVDGNRMNNSIENLVLFQTNAKHLKHELAGRCPNWTQKGFENMCAARPTWAYNRDLALKYGVHPQPQPTDRQTL